MDAADKRMLEREALRNMIQQWNANRLDLFELSEPNENLEFHGVMRFYFQDSGQKIATKCIRVASDATVSDVIETLIEKFRPDMRMLSLGSYSLWETHGPSDERRLEPHEKPLLVQLNWHADDREGRLLLKCGDEQTHSAVNEKGDQNFKRKLSKREKKELKKKEKLSRLKSDANDENRTAEKLYTEMPETLFTRSISNPEAVMRRRRHQKLERKLQQFRSKDGQPDTGGTLKIYGEALCPEVPYKTLLLSVRDPAAAVLREMLDKYGAPRPDPALYCLVQVDASDGSERALEDDECPLAALMAHPRPGSIMFHVRRRPVDSQPRRRKKKATGGSAGSAGGRGAEPALLEVTPDGAALENGRQIRVTDVVEVGSGNGMSLQLYGPSIQSRHCVVAAADGGNCYSVTPLHPDAQVFVNGQRVTHTQRLQHGCLVRFGRASTFRFVDPAQEALLARNLAQSQRAGSGSIYDRSPTSPARAISPTSLASQPPDNSDYQANMSQDQYNNNTLRLDELRDERDQEHSGSHYKDNYETTFDLEGNVETKSICSAKSGGSGHDNRIGALVPASRPGQEPILPAVLEFPEAGQAALLAAVTTRLDPHAPAFKLAPVYTLYLCARYRASTHYRPELSPTERAHKLTAFLQHVAALIHATVQERAADSAAQAFWMANASELLHFLRSDRHVSAFAAPALELLPATVQAAFSNLVSCFQEELSPALATLNSAESSLETDSTEATAPTLQALAAAMVLLRRCRVNAALTIQLFSHLFHYINAVCFNKLVTQPGAATARWGAALAARLALLGAWAERQGLELAADCHLARSHQAARLIQSEYSSLEAVRAALAACFKLNSLQVRALLAPRAPPAVLDAAAAHAAALADELYRADGRELTLEESEWLGVGLLIPGDGFSAEVVRGVPPGLAEFVAPLQRGGLCRLVQQPHAAGAWTVYLAGAAHSAAHSAAARRQQPSVHIIQLNKNSNGMGLSIVAAKGAGQRALGIYIKSVVPGGAAAADGRLAAGDQLLSVDGHSLVGITQEKAAEYLVRTGPCVTLEVARQGAVLHGLATLLQQPACEPRDHRPGPGAAGAMRRASERDLPARLAAEPVKPSKSTPALHHAPPPAASSAATLHAHSGALSPPGGAGGAGGAAWGGAGGGRSRSSHNLLAPPADGFYQNLPHINDRWSSLRSSGTRPQSAHLAAAPELGSESALHHQVLQQNAMSVRAAKLAEMSEEVTRRQQHQQMMQQQQLLQQQQQHQQQLQQQQQYSQQKPPASQHHHSMMTPLHLANLHHMQVQSPQHPSGQAAPLSPPQHYHNHAPPQQRYDWHPPGPPSPQRAQPPVAPKPQGARRPDSEHEDQMMPSQQQMLSPQQQMMSPQQQQLLSPQQQQMLSPQQQQMIAQQQLQMMSPQQQMMSSQQQHMMSQQQHMMSPQQQQMMLPQQQVMSPQQQQMMSPQQQQQMMSPQQQQQMMSPQQQQMMSPQQQNLNNSVQPEEDWYVPGALGPLGPLGPWQREEREREADQRRRQQRQRRDATIAGLSALGAARSPAQSQQLRALQLERDFERRAALADQEESCEPGSPRPRSPPRSPPPGAPRSPPPPTQPKSILKSNRGDVNGYATENGRSEERSVAPASQALAALQLEPPAPPAAAAAPGPAQPPPPPERGSSFAVMAARAPPAAPAPAPAPAPVMNNNNIQTTPTSSQQRDKRVSFHAAPPAPSPPADSPPAPPAASPPPLDLPPQDPDRFIEEAESMLAGPGEPAPGAAHTPGVIGAQEVYRDPRTRRLAEALARRSGAAAAAVPEQLSFKEKMKMFALESGEPHTPRDKVKISRAQRDIDAVH